MNKTEASKSAAIRDQYKVEPHPALRGWVVMRGPVQIGYRLPTKRRAAEMMERVIEHAEHCAKVDAAIAATGNAQ